jgi:curved DNA-binding protein CbpA
VINYYKILELPDFADRRDVRKSYRRLAKQFHPDLHKDNPESEEIFKWINRANATLSNPASRMVYDQKLRTAYIFSKYKPIHNFQGRKAAGREQAFQMAKKIKALEIDEFKKQNRIFPYKYRMIFAIIFLIWGLQICISSWFTNMLSNDDLLIVCGFAIFGFSLIQLMQVVFRTLRVRSFIRQGLAQHYESISVYGFICLLVIGPIFVFAFNELRKDWHLNHYAKTTIAQIVYLENNNVIFEFEAAGMGFIRKKDRIGPDNIYDLNKNWVMVKYSEREPRIAVLVAKKY